MIRRTRRFATLTIMSVLLSVGSWAQTLKVVTGNVVYAFPAVQAGDMIYQSGESLTIMGKVFSISDITEMRVDDSEVEDNKVSVNYDGTTASVTIAGNVARYVVPTVTNAHVAMVQSADVSDDTCGEITYTLAGTSSDGEFALDGSYKASVELNGLNLTNPSGTPLNIQDGKRISVSVKKGTENTLTDAANGDWKGAVVCKGHLELKGKGTLNVYGHTAHGIYSKEYVDMKNCTLNILSAVKDGINCNQYFLMESGELNISGVADDGVQVSFKEDDMSNRDEEDTGTLTIAGGTLNVAVNGASTKGLKAEGNLLITDGVITITSSGDGAWDADDAKSKAASCISADGNIQIDGGTLSLTSTGSGGKGISGDGTLTINDGSIIVSTTGGMYAYVNGRGYTNYTGSSDRLSSSQKSSPKGMRVEGNVDINGGVIKVSTTGNGAEGIESKAVLTISDGTVVVNAYDDCINSSSHMYIKGGDITVVASDNDGLDANGNMYISGGTIRAFGTKSPECGIDANEEDGYSVFFTGGTLLAVGGGNSVPSSSASTQPYVSGTMSVTANSVVTLKSGSTVLATFSVPSNYSSSSSSGGGGGFGGRPGGGGPGGSGSGSSVLVSCAGLTFGNSYTLTCGTSSSSVTAVVRGSNSGGRP